jgi:hypothetical protein
LNFAFYDDANGGIKEADTSSLGDSMLCTRNSALWHAKTGPQSMWNHLPRKWFQIFALIVSFSMPCFSAMGGADNHDPKARTSSWPGIDNKWPPSGPPMGAWQDGFKNWPGPGAWYDANKKWPDLLEMTSKRLELTKSSNKAEDKNSKADEKGNKQAGKDCDFIFLRVSKLLEHSKEARDNPFRFERLLYASNALLNASDFISWSRKTNPTPQDKDFWGAIGMAIQRCYFRVQQADFFAPLSGEKNSEQYTKLSRSLYQQARGAYDAHDYQKAKNLADASESIVIALESLAQAAIPIPKPHPLILK